MILRLLLTTTFLHNVATGSRLQHSHVLLAISIETSRIEIESSWWSSLIYEGPTWANLFWTYSKMIESAGVLSIRNSWAANPHLSKWILVPRSNICANYAPHFKLLIIACELLCSLIVQLSPRLLVLLSFTTNAAPSHLGNLEILLRLPSLAIVGI